MSDLTDKELAWRLDHAMSTNESEFRAVILEVQRHRAMVKRLEAWAEACDRANHPIQSSRDVAAELRNRMRTP